MKSKKTLVLFLILCFLTVLIVVGSVLFSVKTIVGYCYNDNNSALTQSVMDATSSKLKMGTNIFLVNEREIIEQIEKDIPNVKVVNIERKFPSSVYVNYYKIEEYFVLEHEGTYLYVSNEGKILRREDSLAGERRIKLLIGEKPESISVGETLFRTQSQLQSVAINLMNALSCMEEYQNMLEIVEMIDLRFLSKNVLFIKTVAGVCVELQFPENSILKKVQYALSYINAADFNHKSKGTIIVSGSNSIVGSYTEGNRYAEFLSENANF